MSLIGVDGKALEISSSSFPNPFATSIQPASLADMTSQNIWSKHREEVERNMAAKKQTTSSSSSSSLSSCDPINNSSSSDNGGGSVQLDFSEFETEIQDMERKKKEEIEAEIALNCQKIANASSPFTALPSSDPFAKAFHDQIIQKYDKIHNLGLSGKKQFQTRKIARKEARKQKKAQDNADKLEAKGGKMMSKCRSRNRAKAY